MGIDRKRVRELRAAGPPAGDTVPPPGARGASVAKPKTWREPYAVLWAIATAATVEQLESLWAGFPKARRGIRRAVQPYRQKSWKGSRLQPTIRDYELAEALRLLHLRISGPDANPVFADPRLLAIGAPGEALLNLISQLTVYDNPP
jgi:hypothetical protein